LLSKSTVEVMAESICYNSNANPNKDKNNNRWI